MIRLLALDLDGTLVRRDGTIDPADVAAIARARAAGIQVVLATGRLIAGTLPVATELDLDLPMVCADGATLADKDGTILVEDTIDPGLGLQLTDSMSAAGLHPFVFDHHGVHGTDAGLPLAFHARAWSPHMHFRPRLGAVPATTMALGLGPEAGVTAWSASVADHAEVDVVHFGFRTGTWAVRVIRKGVNKGSGVRQLARRLEVADTEVAAVGDWWNDIQMFRQVARSFVMGGAPPEVAQAATDHLTAQNGEGGGVAQAVALLLGR